MTFSAFLFQALNGLSTASGLFFIAVGLSLIFGVSRIINIAHGSLYMLGTYIAYSFATHIGGVLGFWGGIIATALIVGVIGALIEILLLRRIYRAPELFQLLATFALVLVINDATLWIWGSEDLLGPRAPGLRGSIEVLGRRLPTYDVFLIIIGPLVLLVLHFALARTLSDVWCGPQRRIGKWSAPSASTRRCCLRRCLRSAPCSQALAAHCRSHASRQTLPPIWLRSAMPSWSLSSVAWARLRAPISPP
jgi:hypothetical protein